MKNALCTYCAILGGGTLFGGISCPAVFKLTDGLDPDLRILLSAGALMTACVVSVYLALRYHRKHLTEFPCS